MRMKYFAALCAVSLVLASLPSALTACDDSLSSSNGQVCCPYSCGQCGGSGCGQRPGGGDNCCVSSVLASGVSCANSDAPCIAVDDDDDNDESDDDTDEYTAGSFDLSTFYLTLPVTEESYLGYGDDSPAYIQPAHCRDSQYTGDDLDDGYVDSDYFFWNSDGSLTFRTPLYGGPTTPNSNYVRTELRELYDDECDTSDANWSPYGRHVLRGTVRVNEVWSDDPEVCVGQIHAKESTKPLLILRYKGPDEALRININEDPVDGNPFGLDMSLNPGTDIFSYVITLDDGTMTASVTYDGETVSETVRFGNEISEDWYDYTYYFKAGSYPLADASGGGVFEVQFFDIDITHQ